MILAAWEGSCPQYDEMVILHAVVWNGTHTLSRHVSVRDLGGLEILLLTFSQGDYSYLARNISVCGSIRRTEILPEPKSGLNELYV